MKLVLRHEGLPVEVALRIASSQGLVSQKRFDELREELCGIVAEVTVKFIGFFAAKSVKQGLELTLELLSFALNCETAGAHQPDVWIHKMDTLGFKGLVAQAIKHFKDLALLPPLEHATVGETIPLEEPKELIRNCFLSDRLDKGGGYRWFRSKLAERKEAHLTDRLLRHLIVSVTDDKATNWIRRVRLEHGVSSPFVSSAVNTVILRNVLGLKPGLEITYDEFILGQSKLKKEKKTFGALAQKRFTQYVKTIPVEYHDLHQVKAWFEVSFKGSFVHGFDKSNGFQNFFLVHIPSAVEKKIARNNTWSDDVPKKTRARVSLG
jgi:hypothetical protein